jgi:hypothetical protein
LGERGDVVYTGYHYATVDLPVGQMVVASDALLVRRKRAEVARTVGTAVAGSLLAGGAVALGLGLDATGLGDDAALVLAAALADPHDDTALVSRARLALDALARDRHPGGLAGALAEAAAPLGGGVDKKHPLLGAAMPVGPWTLPAAATKPAPDAPPPPTATVVMTWAAWREPSAAALGRLSGLAERYAARGVRVVAVDVGRDAGAALPEARFEAVRGSAAAMRALRLIALPSVVIADAKGVVREVLPGYDSLSLELEEALDPLLPPEPPAED